MLIGDGAPMLEVAVAPRRGALVVAPHWAGGQAQFVERPVPEFRTGDVIGDAMRFALDNLGMDVVELASAVHLSRRTFDRRFRETTGSSPLQWLLTQRVLHAQRILATTDLDIDAVARASGFTDGVALRPHFRRIVGVARQTYRRSFNAA